MFIGVTKRDNAGVTRNVAKMWEDYAKSIGVATKNLTQQQKIQAEVTGILEESKFQIGDAAKVAGTYQGQVLMLGFAFNNLRVAVGNAIMPIAQRIIPVIATIINWFTRLFNVIAQVTAALFGTKMAIGGTASAIGGATTANEDLASAGGNAADSQKDLAKGTKAAGKAAKGSLSSLDELRTIQEDIASGAGGAGAGAAGGAGALELPEMPTGQIFGDMEVDPELEAWLQRFLELLQPTIEAIDRLKQALEPFKTFVAQGLEDFLNNFLVPLGLWTLGEGLPRFFDIISAFFNEIDWGRLTNVFADLYSALAPFAIEIGRGLLDFFEYVLKPLAVWTVGEGLPRFIEGITFLLNNIDWGVIREGLISVYNAIVPFATKIGEGLLWFYEEVLIPLGLWVGNEFLPAFLEALAAVIDGMGDNLQVLGNAFVFLWDKALKPLMGFVGDTIIAFLRWIADNADDVADLIIGITAGFVAFKTALAIGTAISAIPALIASISTAFSALQANLGLIIVAFGIAQLAMIAVGDHSAGITIAVGLLSGAFIALGVAMTLGFGPVGWAVGTIAGLATAIGAIGIALSKDAIPPVERFSDAVSDMTQKALTPIMDLSDKVSGEITKLFATSTPLTLEETGKIAGYFTEMADTAISELEKMKNSAIDNLTAMFGKEAEEYEKALNKTNKFYDAQIAEIERKNDALENSVREAKLKYGEESQEYADTVKAFEENNSKKIAEIDKINNARDDEIKKLGENASEEVQTYIESKEALIENYDGKIEAVETKNEEMNEILKQKLKDGQVLTEEDYKLLQGAQEEFLGTITDNLSANATESKAIQEQRQKDLYSIQVKEASEILKEAKKQKDEQIKLAEDTYKEKIAQAEKLKADGTEQSKLMADNIIAQAEREKEESIGLAEEKYNGIVGKINDANPQILKAIDAGNGEIKSKFDTFWEDIKTSWSKFFSGLKTGWDNFWAGLSGKSVNVAQTSTGFSTSVSGRNVIPENLTNVYRLDTSTLPHFARGGIVSKETLAVLGERGREAVVPLENNTGWISNLASQLNSQNNGNQETNILLQELIDAIKNLRIQSSISGGELLTVVESAGASRGVQTSGGGFINAF